MDEKNPEIFEISTDFEYEGKKAFQGSLKISGCPNAARKYTFELLFRHIGHHNWSYNPEEVICSIQQDDNSSTEPVLMEHSRSYGWNSDQQLTMTSLSRSVLITFRVKLTCSFYVNNEFVDSDWSEQLWDAAIKRKMTNIEFLVGEETFDAHRSILSARSPVFAAMFASGMKETATGQVRIEDVDPDVFQKLLKFLYMGTFEPSPMDRDLFTVADKYQVTTLMELCRPAI